MDLFEQNQTAQKTEGRGEESGLEEAEQETALGI